MKLLFFSFWLILATSQPSAQDSANTNTDSRNTSSTPPITAAVGAGVATQ